MEETYSKLKSSYTALYTCFNNWLQSVPAGTGYIALYTCFNDWLQSVPAGGYRVSRPVPATQSCTLASTLVTECTGRYQLYSLVHFSNWLHMASTYRLQVYRQGTAYTVLTVQCFTQLVT